VYTAGMNCLMVLLQFASFFFPNAPAEHFPGSVVQELYQQVVAHKPLGIPKGADKAAIWPLLSNRLTQKLDAAQACEDDYYRQMTDKNSKPGFAWLENGLFSGANEEATPSAVALERTEPSKNGSFRVYVRLTYKESFETYDRPPNPADTFHWRVVAVVKSQGERFVVDDILFFKVDSTKIASRLTEFFKGCDGSRWVGVAQYQNDFAGLTPRLYELYSWPQSDRTWDFCLLLSPSGVNIPVEVIFNKQVRLTRVDELKRKISLLPTGTTILWMNGITSGQTPTPESEKLALPPVETVEQVKRYAGERGVLLLFYKQSAAPSVTKRAGGELWRLSRFTF
jgi:hypothetical protein